jgi:transcriptional antiterminator NusG
MEENQTELVELEVQEEPDVEEEASEQVDEEEEQLAPEERARRLFASYLEEEPETTEAETEDKDEDEDAEISLSELLDESDLVLLEGEQKTPKAREGDEEDDEEISTEGRNWYVVHSYSGYENKVKKNLEHRIESLEMQDKIFDVVVPTEEEIELKDGQRRTVERRIFPGYILVDMLMDEDSWYVVRNTPGVTGFVGSIRKPTPLRQRDVDRILKRMRAETPRVKVTFRHGQKVRIADGPFEDFVGAVDEIYPEKGKVRILVSFFGRETPVELDFLQVEKI